MKQVIQLKRDQSYKVLQWFVSLINRLECSFVLVNLGRKGVFVTLYNFV